MLDFRKALIALSVAGLGLVGTASAQLVPTVSAVGVSSPTYAAIEGTTELLPLITFTAAENGGVTGGQAIFTLTANVPITNVQPSALSPNLDIIATDNNGDIANVTVLSATSVQVSFPAVTGALTSITVTGIRTNASLATSPTITITPSALPGNGIVFSGTGAGAIPEAFVVKSLVAPVLVGSANQALSGTVATAQYPVVTATIAGAFADSFKSVADYKAPGAGAVTPAQGTRLAVTFTNLNANVNYYVPQVIAGAGTLTMNAYSAATGSTLASLVGGSGPAAAEVALPTPVGGSSTIYYGVNTSEGLTIPSFAILVNEVIPSQAAVTAVSSVGVGVSVTLVGVTTGYPQFSGSQTPYTASQTVVANTNGLLTLSTTTLLFPYVINIGGYDTGIAITNATAGLAAGVYSATATGTAGTANVYFYGANPPTPNPLVLPVVAGGSYTAFLASTAAPGFAGYLVVTANFAGAHGFAFITDGFGGGGRGLSEGYLAIVTAIGAAATAPTF
jgi:hypothetical protein